MTKSRLREMSQVERCHQNDRDGDIGRLESPPVGEEPRGENGENGTQVDNSHATSFAVLLTDFVKTLYEVICIGCLRGC